MSDPYGFPRPVSYEPFLGTSDETAKKDHVHNVVIEEWVVVPDAALLNFWTNPLTILQQCRYLRDIQGMVHIEGKLDAGTVTAGTDLFVLPPGFRPPLDLRMPAVTSSGAAIISIAIRSSGLVEIGPTAAVTNLYFNVLFEADREKIDITRS